MVRSAAKKAAIHEINVGHDVPIRVPQAKYLNNIVEQDQWAIKRVTRPMLNFKLSRSAGNVLAGIDFRLLIRRVQFTIDGAAAMSFAEQFYALAGKIRAA